jgi:hypothetical protein
VKKSILVTSAPEGFSVVLTQKGNRERRDHPIPFIVLDDSVVIGLVEERS